MRNEINACELNLALMGTNFRNGFAYFSAWFETTSTVGYCCCLPCRLVRFVQTFCSILQWLLEQQLPKACLDMDSNTRPNRLLHRIEVEAAFSFSHDVIYWGYLSVSAENSVGTLFLLVLKPERNHWGPYRVILG